MLDTMPETTVEFLHLNDLFVLPVQVEGFVFVKDRAFTPIGCVLNVHIGLTVEVGQPFQGGKRVGFPLLVPTADGFGGQCAVWHAFDLVEEISNRSNSDASLHLFKHLNFNK